MSNLNSLVDEVMGLPRGHTALKEVKRQFARPTPLAKAMPAIEASIASIKRTQRALAKSLKTAPTKADHRRQHDRVKAAVDAGIAEGRLSAAQVARLENELNGFAVRHGL